MTAAAPSFRSVCQLTGDVARPSAFFRALSEADYFCADLVEVKQLRAENAALRRRLAELGEEPPSSDAASAAEERSAADAPANLPVPAADHPAKK